MLVHGKQFRMFKVSVHISKSVLQCFVDPIFGRQDAIFDSLDDRVIIDVEIYIPRRCCDGVSDADDMYNEGDSKCPVMFRAEGADCFRVPWCHA